MSASRSGVRLPRSTLPPRSSTSPAALTDEPEKLFSSIPMSRKPRLPLPPPAGYRLASDMIAEAVTTMEFAGTAEDIARICHAHPTLSEIVREAALALPLHFDSSRRARIHFRQCGHRCGGQLLWVVGR